MELNKIYFGDNLEYDIDIVPDLIFADMIYDNLDFRWVEKYWRSLKKSGVFIVMTDYHTVAQLKLFMDRLEDSNFINWCIYKQEWGGVPRTSFPQKHDDILIYSKGKEYKWYGDRIQIPKVTAGTKLDKKGTGLKTPCSVFDDLGNFSTISRERVKKEDGHNIQWQKPLKLMDRLFLPFTDEGDIIVDPFFGSGTTGEWCIKNNRNFIGIENDKNPYKVSLKRMELNK